MDTLSHLIDSSLVIEKLRVQSAVRLKHLERVGKRDIQTEELHERIRALEAYVDGTVASLIHLHPAYHWFSRVKGIGKENIGKVIYKIRVKPDSEDPKLLYADTISALWKYAGFSVEDGKSLKRVAGAKLHYNSQLRSMCWRLGGSLLKAKGIYYEYYLKEKEKYEQKYTNQEMRIVPASALPKKDGKRYEPPDIISTGHVHNQALRKMIKRFLANLWLVWREAEGLPVTKPYVIEQLGHNSFVDPWEMIDR